MDHGVTLCSGQGWIIIYLFIGWIIYCSFTHTGGGLLGTVLARRPGQRSEITVTVSHRLFIMMLSAMGGYIENIYLFLTLSLYLSINPGQITAARVDSWAILSLVLDVSWKYTSTPHRAKKASQAKVFRCFNWTLKQKYFPHL